MLCLRSKSLRAIESGPCETAGDSLASPAEAPRHSSVRSAVLAASTGDSAARSAAHEVEKLLHVSPFALLYQSSTEELGGKVFARANYLSYHGAL